MRKRRCYPACPVQSADEQLPLKEIADVCGITKPLTTHIARHTFACLAVANKVSMESIAKMLGHSDIRTTKIYAKILDRTVSDEMQTLRQKFAV